MRWLWSFLIAVLIVVGSFVLILVMIFPPQSADTEPPLQVGYFVPKLQTEASDPGRSRIQLPDAPAEPQLEAPPQQQAPQPPSTPPAASLELAAAQLPSSVNLTATITPNLQGLTARTSPPAEPAAPAAPATTAPAAAPAQSTQSASAAHSSAPAPSADAEVIPLNEVLPVYPESARRRGIEGYVKLAFTITPQGRVENVQILESSPSRVFDREARRAALRWRFAPRREGGELVAREAVKKLEFRLEKRGR